METPPVLRPFRGLTEGFGVPAYHMVDPTLFVAITFLIMFGMMFGDIGHGLVLLIGGALLSARVPGLADMGKLAVYCGVSSMIFGVLFGSVFGFEGLIPALWLHPLSHTGALFGTAVGFGVVFISLGLVLNSVNAIRRGTFAHEFFEASGPLVVVAYWARCRAGRPCAV
jgi:V/A-type H+-transporting ATPase subunit I